MPKREKPQPKKLEEHEPGAIRNDVFQALEKVAKGKPKTSDESPAPSSSET